MIIAHNLFFETMFQIAVSEEHWILNKILIGFI